MNVSAPGAHAELVDTPWLAPGKLGGRRGFGTLPRQLGGNPRV